MIVIIDYYNLHQLIKNIATETRIIQVRLSHHCGVPAADELSDLKQNAFTVGAFVQRASFHDDRHS